MKPDQSFAWRVIAVLTSTVRLEPALSLKLYHSAVTLHRVGGQVERWHGDTLSGEVKNLNRELLIGALSGPGFEATVETEEGTGRVRFIVTRDGLDAAETHATRDARLRAPTAVLN